MRTIISAEDVTTKAIEDFRNASVEKQRFLVYSGKVHVTGQTVKYETEEKLCYFQEQLRPRFGTKGFIERKAVGGVTFDKKTKKLKVWFGIPFLKMSHSLKVDMFKDLKMEWVNAMGYKLDALMTRMLLEKIFKGKITNPRDYVKSYVKTHLRVKSVPPELYYKLFRGDVTLEGSKHRDVTPGQLNDILRHAKNPAWVVQNYLTADIFSNHTLCNDITKECKILGKKFDWSWSFARIAEEHKMMSREIRGMELEYIENTTIGYTNPPQLPEGWEFITNQKRLFIEGSEQDHCVYNYWSQVERKSLFILSIKNGRNKVTASIDKSYGWGGTPKRWEVSQIYGLRNDNCPEEFKCSPETKQAVKEWVEKPEIQKFFEDQQENEASKFGTVAVAPDDLPF